MQAYTLRYRVQRLATQQSAVKPQSVETKHQSVDAKPQSVDEVDPAKPQSVESARFVMTVLLCNTGKQTRGAKSEDYSE